MKVLLVNHTGLKSGAEVTTLNLLHGLPDHVHATLACPPGPLADEALTAGVPVVPVAGMAGSLRLHGVQTPRALADLSRLARDVRRAARRVDADVVHATSIRAGLAAAVPAGSRPPAVVSIHDCLPAGRATTLTRRAIDAGAQALVANSRYTAAAWREGRAGPAMRVVHPSVGARDGDAPPDRAAARALLGLPAAAPVLGVAAQITPWKGQDTAIRALAHLRPAFPDALLVLAGETKFVERATRYDNRGYAASLRRLVADLGLEDAVRFLGQRDDMPAVLASLDVLLVPSWEEPFGLVAVEAMAAGVPVVATRTGGPPEVIEDGHNGRLVAPRQPALWAAAAGDLLARTADRERIVAAGRRTARRFDHATYVAAVVESYGDALRARTPSSTS